MIWKLFFSFIKIGLFSVGGGYAAIPLIQNQIVDIHGLMTLEEFTDLIAIPPQVCPYCCSVYSEERTPLLKI